MERIKRFMKEEEGVTAIEYGLLAALIAVICMGTWALIGTSLNTKFVEVNTKLGG